MKNGPDLWAEILRQVRPAYGDSVVIAGGCVRDYLLGIEAKDIDVFVNVDDPSPPALDLPRRFSVSALIEETDYRSEGSDFAAEVAGVQDGTYTDSDGDKHAVQIIARPHDDFSGAQLMGQLDIDICRSWFDGECIHETEEALDARTLGRIKALRPNNRTQDRLSRLGSRLGLKVAA